MQPPLVIVTGTSGVGKTCVAHAVEDLATGIVVYQGDLMGFPAAEIVAGYGHTDEPGGPLQRAFALHWLGVIAEQHRAGKPVLLETQCRIAFLREALALHMIEGAQIILFECSDESRRERLRGRGQAELADEQMKNWSHFLHLEAKALGAGIYDTTEVSVEESTAYVLEHFTRSHVTRAKHRSI